MSGLTLPTGTLSRFSLSASPELNPRALGGRYAAGFAATVSQEDRGIVSITLTAAKTVLIKPGRYVYDVKIMTPTGGEYKAVEGSALVRGGVTR